jgi:hypothetical protein
MNSKFIFLTLLAIFILLTGSAAAWIYFQPDIHKKDPIRAKQVFINGGIRTVQQHFATYNILGNAAHYR